MARYKELQRESQYTADVARAIQRQPKLRRLFKEILSLDAHEQAIAVRVVQDTINPHRTTS